MEVQAGTNDDKMNLRVASFSCYLDDSAKDKSIHKMSAPKDSTSDLLISNVRVDSSILMCEKLMFNVPPPKQLDFPHQQVPHKKKAETSMIKPVNLKRSGGSQTLTKLAKKGVGRLRRIFILLGFGRCRGACFKDEERETTSLYRTTSSADTITNMEEECRRSIEVFGSRDVVAKNMERKLSMLTWDAIPKARNLIILCDDDMASEACSSSSSSDLFEIDNIIINSGNSVLMRDEEVSMSSSPISSSWVYAPSELG